MNKPPISRREFFRWTATAGAATVAAGVVLGQVACGGKGDGPSCDSPSGLSLADKQTRTVNKYVEPSVTKGKNCLNCQLFKPAADPNACGTCTVIKGTVSPLGNCALWAEKKPAA